MLVCQCWDDGVTDDVRLTGLLRRHAATATFNLNPGLHRSERYHHWTYLDRKPVWKLALSELTQVYRGFDIANHTVSHPRLTELDDQRLASEIRDGKAALERIFGTDVPGFAYPYGVYDQRCATAVAAAGHSYARTTLASEHPLPAGERFALHPTCHHLADDFWARFEQARAVDGVFWLWGHSYEFLDDAMWNAFEAKLIRIAAEPSARWARIPDMLTTWPS